MSDCPECEGTGQKRWKHRESEHHSSGSVTKCPFCGGTGKKHTRDIAGNRENLILNPVRHVDGD